MPLVAVILACLCGCATLRDTGNDFPPEIAPLCERALADGQAQVERILGRPAERKRGWRVVLVDGIDSPYGKALRCAASPTGWAAAVTEHDHTTVVRSRATMSVLSHEARHYWANMNDVEVGL